MSHGTIDLSLSIRGVIQTEEMLDDLVDAAGADEAQDKDWGTPPSLNGYDIRQYILGCDGGTLLFTARDYDSEGFAELEAACVRHGLGFVRTIDPDGDNDVDGSRCIFNPGLSPEPFDLPGSDAATPLIEAAIIHRLIVGGAGGSPEATLAAIARQLSRAMQPTAGMPEGITIDPSLTAAHGMRR